MSSQNATTAVFKAPVDPNAVFVFHIDLFLLAIFGVFVLYALPRTITRFCHGPEWGAGLFLHHVNVKPPRRPSTRPERTFGSAYITDMRSDDSHARLVRGASSRSQRAPALPAYDPRLPPHFPAHSTHVPALARLLRHPLAPHTSVGNALLRALWAAALVYALLYRGDPFAQPVRAGYVAFAQLPLVVALAAKNNVPGWLLGMSYEKLNYLHRFGGRLLILLANIHALGYIYRYALAGTIKEQLRTPYIAWGLVAVVWLDIMLLMSLSFWRRKQYMVFITYHITGVVIVLVALHNHAAAMSKYALVAGLIYAADRVLRLLRTRLATATLRPLPELGSTRIEVPALNAGWRAGQHVRLRVLSLGMGALGWAEAHPFTIQSAARSADGAGVVLTVKHAGDWTRRLGVLAAAAGYDGEKAALGTSRRVRVTLEGPYGGTGHTLLGSFSGALLVAGGSGITWALGCAQALARGPSAAGHVELVWSVRDPGMLAPLLPTFCALMSEAGARGVGLRVAVYYTRASATAQADIARMYLPPGIALHAGRPRVGKILDALLARVRGGAQGVVVGCCGPAEMADEARAAVGAADREAARAVGGVEIHEESFSL